MLLLFLPLLSLDLLLLLFEVRVVGFGPVVVSSLVDDEAIGDADNVEQPEQVERLQGEEEREGNPEGKLALVLFRLPVQLVGTNRLELVEHAEQDAPVQVVPRIDPHTHEEEEVALNNGVVQVVEGL